MDELKTESTVCYFSFEDLAFSEEEDRLGWYFIEWVSYSAWMNVDNS